MFVAAEFKALLAAGFRNGPSVYEHVTGKGLAVRGRSPVGGVRRDTVQPESASNANAHRRKTWRAVPAVWSPKATLQVALSGRLSVHRMSGSAPVLPWHP